MNHKCLHLRARLLARKLEALTGLCDPECEGRCKACPADLVQNAIATLREYASTYEQPNESKP